MFEWLRSKNPFHLALQFNEYGFACAVSNQKEKPPSILECNSVSIQENEPLQRVLGEFTHQNRLRHCDTTLVLAPTDYELFVLVAPEKDPSEWTEIIRWELADYLPYDAQEAVIETQTVFHGDEGKVLVAVMRQQRLKELVDLCESASISPKNILLPPTTFLNLLKNIPELCMVLLYWTQAGAWLFIYHDQEWVDVIKLSSATKAREKNVSSAEWQFFLHELQTKLHEKTSFLFRDKSFQFYCMPDLLENEREAITKTCNVSLHPLSENMTHFSKKLPMENVANLFCLLGALQ